MGRKNVQTFEARFLAAGPPLRGNPMLTMWVTTQIVGFCRNFRWENFKSLYVFTTTPNPSKNVVLIKLTGSIPNLRFVLNRTPSFLVREWFSREIQPLEVGPELDRTEGRGQGAAQPPFSGNSGFSWFFGLEKSDIFLDHPNLFENIPLFLQN